MTALTDYPADDDPRTHTLHGVPPMPLRLPDTATCTEDEFYDLCRDAMRNLAVRDRLARSDVHLWTVVNKVLALAAENETLRKQLDTSRRISLGHADHAQQLLLLNETQRNEAIRARDCVRAMAHQLATALTELGTKDQEIELLRGFDLASRSIMGVPAAALSERLVPEPHNDPFGPPDETRVWTARGTDPANETVVVDEPWGGK